MQQGPQPSRQPTAKLHFNFIYQRSIDRDADKLSKLEMIYHKWKTMVLVFRLQPDNKLGFMFGPVLSQTELSLGSCCGSAKRRDCLQLQVEH